MPKKKNSRKNKSSNKLNIICLSNQLWDFENWTNKKHVMFRLAKSGHNVLFVDPPINTGNVFYKYAKKGFWPLGRLLTQTKKDKCGAFIYSPLNLIPFTKITAFLHALRIRILRRRFLDRDLKTILWVYNVEIPELSTYLKLVPYDLLIYDCVDNYEGFPRYDTKEKKERVRNIERNLAERADIVFATAPGLVDKMKKYNNNVVYAPNVGDYGRFKDAKKNKYKLPEELAAIPTPRVGFVGALDKYKFDLELMKKLLSDHPEISFVLIGQMALKDKMASLDEVGLSAENLYYLGSKPFDEVSLYYAGFDAYIIPYVLNDYTVGGCFPVKFHEALAVGLPTVVTNLPSYAPFRDVSYIAKNYQEFSELIKKALDEDTIEKVRQRQEVASENSWNKKVEKMLSIVRENLK